MNSNQDHHKIIEQLKQLPKIKDHTDKNDLYEQIRMQMNRSSEFTSIPKPTKKNKLIPLFSLALVVVIVLIMLPSFINQTSLQMSEKRSNESIELFDTQENGNTSSLNMQESSEELLSKANQLDHHKQSYVLDNVGENRTIIYGAIVEEQLQFVIPISLILNEESDLSTAYNELHHYLKEEEWGVLSDLFSGVTFDIDLSNEQVMLKLPAGFSLGDGSAKANIVLEMLTTMFQPYGIEKVIFQPENDHDFDLGPYGNISETKLLEPVVSNYKLFKHPEGTRAFLVPIKTYDQPIIEALHDMKYDEEEDLYHISKTIPDDVEFNVESVENKLIIRFADNVSLKNEQLYITMIDAILMTAKSYGYDSVKFENFHVNHIGPYDLTNSIEVPLAINPINIQEKDKNF